MDRSSVPTLRLLNLMLHLVDERPKGQGGNSLPNKVRTIDRNTIGKVPANPTPLLARMTAGFAAGQIAGPVLVWAMGNARIAGWGALNWANSIATVLLATTAIWLWRGVNRLPEAKLHLLRRGEIRCGWSSF